jgi:2-keto-3-deoxy-L-rhamnonate aldolase RhmA|nr:aldolase/citrate lyase family protein [uncultured Caldimonas sp.]
MNPFKHLLKSAGSHPPVGTWILSADPIVAEAIGHAGFEWAVLDMEHAPADTMDIVHLLQAVSSTRLVPVVRVPWNEPVVVKRVLDAGATTVMFPFVQDAEQARSAVAATRYPPHGVRGVVGMSRASRYGMNPHYLTHANSGICTIVQIETPDACRVVESIAAVEGVDAVFVGPADLSAAMGHLGHPAHPSVLDAMSRAVQCCKRLGMPIGTVGGTPDAVAQYRAIGFDFVGVASDLGLMMRGATAALSALKTQDVDIVHSVTAGTLTGAAASGV